jgi:glycosyltransferase involved in cell wall biosynthesis
MNNSEHSTVPQVPAWLFEEVDTPSGWRLPYFLTQLNTMWPDLQDRLDIHVNTEQGVLNSIAFWENPLRHSSPDFAWPTSNEFPELSYQADPSVMQDAVLPITKGMVAAKNVRTDMEQFDLSHPMGRLQFVQWRLMYGHKEYRYLVLRPEEVQALYAPCTRFEGRLAHLPSLVELLPLYFGHQPDTVAALQAGDVATFEACWGKQGAELEAMIEAAAAWRITAHPTPAMGDNRAGGINIIGMPSGQFGIGEDARTATRALLKAGITPVVCEPPIPLAGAAVQKEWLNHLIRRAPEHHINLITMPAADTLRLYFLQWSGALHQHYNICAWQWELPHWPQRWHQLLNIPDEIWAQSRFVQQMFQQVTDKPVTYMPLAVDAPVFTPLSREHFDLNEQATTFLSVFDCNSWFQRKNPMCAIRAFQQAFPKGRKDVQLVIKMMNSRTDLPEYRELMRTAAQDLRIVVIDQFLSRNDMLALLDCADVFVSLHRSEGFGRVVAECMLMGKPVISTNYSGSVDFAFKGTSYVVDGPLVPLKKGDYSEYEGQHCMDPDVGLAAQAMQRCVDDSSGTAAMALRGQAHVQTHHSIEAIAQRYQARLAQLGVVGA